MAFDKLKKLIGDEDEKDVSGTGTDDEFYSVNKDAFKEMSGGSSKMVLLEPRAYSESQAIADYLKSRNTVVVNLKRVTPEIAKRIVDFLSGTLYAIGGDLQKLGNGIFLCTPNNVSIEGKISNDDKLKNKKEDTEYNW